MYAHWRAEEAGRGIIAPVIQIPHKRKRQENVNTETMYRTVSTSKPSYTKNHYFCPTPLPSLPPTPTSTTKKKTTLKPRLRTHLIRPPTIPPPTVPLPAVLARIQTKRPPAFAFTLLRAALAAVPLPFLRRLQDRYLCRRPACTCTCTAT